MNKLIQLIESLVGKELTADNLKEVKAQAEQLKVKLDNKDTEIKRLGDELKPFQDAANETTLKEAFVKAGGHESQFEKAKRNGLTADNVSDKIKDFPSLSKEAEPEYKGTNGGQFGNGGDGEGDGNGAGDDDVMDVT